MRLRNKEEIYVNLSSKKHLATKEEKNPNLKFVSKRSFLMLSEQTSLSIAIETRKINNWKLNDDLILQLLEDIKKSEVYINYMNDKSKSFEE